MEKYRNKIIAVLVILGVLAAVFMLEGGAGRTATNARQAKAAQSEQTALAESAAPSDSAAPGASAVPGASAMPGAAVAPGAAAVPGAFAMSSESAASQESEAQPIAAAPSESAASQESAAQPIAAESVPLSGSATQVESAAQAGGAGSSEQAAVAGESAKATLDRYQTSPVPEGKPLPVEPQTVTASETEAFSITISVRCDTILDNMHLLNKEKWELIPDDGFVLPETEATAYEGESVFNILQREMKRAAVHMEFMNTPIYNSAYIEGINNIYEFEVGELSGWMYKVNGWFPNYGCSRYQVKAGDRIEWLYTCNLGRDLGEFSLGGFQRDE
jgi:hypothetical protein